MKKLIIAFGLIIMIAGGTVSVLKWMEVGPFIAAETDKPVEAPPTDPEKMSLVDMAPMTISIFQDNRVAAMVQIHIKLETTDIDNVLKIKHMMPRINDAFMRELHGYIPRLIRKTGRLDVQAIKARLMLLTEKVAEKGVITGVLIQSVNERKM
jgi:flagellar basal body-associated protein FliL